MPSRLSRRGFLRSGLAAGAVLSLPAATYRTLFAADTKPSETVRVGIHELMVARHVALMPEQYAGDAVNEAALIGAFDQQHLTRRGVRCDEWSHA